tara:strand:+ start:315 stop:710 length:396 start_codon:yes stop_codon:yes gene_type:complete
MKYLNEETQFTRVSDEHANMFMESMGYDTQTIQEVEPAMAAPTVYKNEDERFILTNEVVEGDDDSMYVRLERLEEGAILHVDESGNEKLTEAISYEDEDYLLEGVFEDEDGSLYAMLVSEGVEEEYIDEEE